MNTIFLKLLTVCYLKAKKEKNAISLYVIYMYRIYTTFSLQGSSFSKDVLAFIFYHCREVRVPQF